MIFGDPMHIKTIESRLCSTFLVKHTGSLDDEGSSIKFIGRQLKRQGSGILMFEDPQYYVSLLEEMNMVDCKEAKTPATQSTPSVSIDDECQLDADQWKTYRR